MRLLLSKRTDMIDLHFYGNNKYALRQSKRYVTCWAVYSCVICWVFAQSPWGSSFGTKKFLIKVALILGHI